MIEIMKMSKFNFTTFDQDGNLILYNFLKGISSLTKVMKPNVKKFSQIFLTDAKIFSSSCINHAEVINSLYKSGILVADDIDESVLYDSVHYNYVHDNKLTLFILPTGECNFNCTYCFESKKPFFRGAMTLDAQDAILKFVQRQIPNHKAVHVYWFGGEPLLEHQVVKRLSDKFIKICNARFLPYYAEIITNGYLLDIEMFDMLYNSKVYNYMVTVDGFKEQHDKQRFTCNGIGTYDVILKNLSEIRNSKKYKFAHIRIRVNMTRRFLNILDDFIYFIDSLFSDDPRFSFQFEVVRDFSGSKSSKNDEQNIYDELTLRLQKNDVYMNKFYPEENKISLIDQGRKCVAGLKNSYVITPDLNVYKCHVHYNMKANNIGCISFKGDLLIDDTLHKRWYLINKYVQKIPDTCNDCFYLPACHYGSKVCPVRYLKPKQELVVCPMENEEHIKRVTATILYAVNKHPCTTLTI